MFSYEIATHLVRLEQQHGLLFAPPHVVCDEKKLIASVQFFDQTLVQLLMTYPQPLSPDILRKQWAFWVRKQHPTITTTQFQRAVECATHPFAVEFHFPINVSDEETLQILCNVLPPRAPTPHPRGFPWSVEELSVAKTTIESLFDPSYCTFIHFGVEGVKVGIELDACKRRFQELFPSITWEEEPYFTRNPTTFLKYEVWSEEDRVWEVKELEILYKGWLPVDFRHPIVGCRQAFFRNLQTAFVVKSLVT